MTARSPLDGTLRGRVESGLDMAVESAERIVVDEFDTLTAAGLAGPDTARLRRLFEGSAG